MQATGLEASCFLGPAGRMRRLCFTDGGWRVLCRRCAWHTDHGSLTGVPLPAPPLPRCTARSPCDVQPKVPGSLSFIAACFFEI